MKALLQFLGFIDRPPAEGLTASVSATTVGPGVSIKGELRGEGPLIMFGHFEGEITLTGTVHIGPEARVDANITAGEIVVAGAVRGNLSAAGRIEILATGSLTGTLKGGSLAAGDGAKVKGEVWIEPTAAGEASVR